MKFLTRAGCYHACGKPARRGRLFCSDRCAAEWAEALAAGNDDAWCPTCQAWNTASQCDHGKLPHPLDS